MNASELLKRRRNCRDDVKTGVSLTASGQMQRLPVYCLHDIRRKDSMTCLQGNLWNTGTQQGMQRERPKATTSQGLSTDALVGGGLSRSS